jgi:hypothetical protein
MKTKSKVQGLKSKVEAAAPVALSASGLWALGVRL